VRAQTKTSCSYLTSWYNSIFGHKLRTIEAENAYKVTNSELVLNSEFTGSYKKKVY